MLSIAALVAALLDVIAIRGHSVVTASRALSNPGVVSGNPFVAVAATVGRRTLVEA